MEESENRNFFKDFIICTLIEFFITIMLFVTLSLLLSFTPLEENIIQPAIIGISSFAIMIGGLLISRKLKLKGILIGSLQGIIYMLILYLFSSFINMDFSLTLKSFTMIIVGVLGGAIGGIVGVNLK